MFIYIAGGTASGKSEYAEKRAAELACGEKIIYAATMRDESEDSLERIERHRRMREWYDHETFNCFSTDDMKRLTEAAEGRTVLFDCLSGYMADLLFGDEPVSPDRMPAAAEAAGEDIKILSEKCRHLIIVSDLIYSDGNEYDRYIENYIRALGRAGCIAAEAADEAVEVVCGIPVFIKKKG